MSHSESVDVVVIGGVGRDAAYPADQIASQMNSNR